MQRFVLVLGAALLLGTLGESTEDGDAWAPSVGAAALLLSLAVALFVRLEAMTSSLASLDCFSSGPFLRLAIHDYP